MPQAEFAQDSNGKGGIIVLAPNEWHLQWVNRQQLMSRLGRTWRVIYSTGGWFVWDRSSPTWWRAQWSGGFHPANNVWLDASPRVWMRWPRLPAYDSLVRNLQARRWRRFLRKRGARSTIAYVFHPRYAPYVKAIDADFLVYHVFDMFDHTPGWTDDLERYERELVQHADLVVASSEQMAENLRRKVDREVHVLPNGADVASYQRALQERERGDPLPADLSSIPRPRIGYAGQLHGEVDYPLIAELARRNPSHHYVFVGPVSSGSGETANAERAACAALPNVHFLGEKRVDEVPRYSVNMDVNLMCYRLSNNNWIKAIYPLKLHEYLATGHPIVSADVPTVRPFADVVRIAKGIDDWDCAIREALEGRGRGTPDERRAVAAQNSWDKRVEALDSWLSRLVSQAG